VYLIKKGLRKAAGEQRENTEPEGEAVFVFADKTTGLITTGRQIERQTTLLSLPHLSPKQ